MYLTKNGKSPFYQIVFFIGGKRKTKSTHTADIKKAQLFLISFRPENIVAKPTFDPISLSVFCKEYLAYKGQINSVSYCKRSIIPAFNFLQSYCADLPLHCITVKQIDGFITHTANRSASSAALYYRTLKAAFSKAVTWNHLSENPFKKIKAPKVQKSLPLFITKEELNTILNYTTNQTLKDLFNFAFYTGMRLGEIVNCQWGWIDFKQNIIKTKCNSSFTTKSKKERIVPICLTLKSILLNHFPKVVSISNEDFVFTRIPGIKLNENYVSKQFKKSLRAANLNDDIHFHSLRHSFASNLVQRGVNLYVVKELLGHEDIKTTQIYSHLTQISLSNAVCLL